MPVHHEKDAALRPKESKLALTRKGFSPDDHPAPRQSRPVVTRFFPAQIVHPHQLKIAT